MAIGFSPGKLRQGARANLMEEKGGTVSGSMKQTGFPDWGFEEVDPGSSGQSRTRWA